MNMTHNGFPYPTYQAYTLTYERLTIDKIREVIREELHKALHPEEERPSATVEYEHNGQRWRGTVYLVEDADMPPLTDE